MDERLIQSLYPMLYSHELPLKEGGLSPNFKTELVLQWIHFSIIIIMNKIMKSSPARDEIHKLEEGWVKRRLNPGPICSQAGDILPNDTPDTPV